MSEKEIITPTEEEKKEEVKSAETKPTEGTMEAELAKEEPTGNPEAKEAETVPLSVFLELKKDTKELKREIKEAKASNKEKVSAVGAKDLSDKYPDVSQDFINDILSTATSNAQKKVEEKYSPIFEQQESERKQATFNKAFDKLFDKTMKDNPDLPKTIDKEMIKTLALTQQYRNTPLTDILTQMYGNTIEGKSSSENEVRVSADKVEDMVSFDNITKDQRDTIMGDDKLRKKFFDWADTQ